MWTAQIYFNFAAEKEVLIPLFDFGSVFPFFSWECAAAAFAAVASGGSFCFFAPFRSSGSKSISPFDFVSLDQDS